jgi:hypothetical protein
MVDRLSRVVAVSNAKYRSLELKCSSLRNVSHEWDVPVCQMADIGRRSTSRSMRATWASCPLFSKPRNVERKELRVIREAVMGLTYTTISV